MFRGQTALVVFFGADRAPFQQCHILRIQGWRLKYKSVEKILNVNPKTNIKLEYPKLCNWTSNSTYVVKHTSRSILSSITYLEYHGLLFQPAPFVRKGTYDIYNEEMSFKLKIGKCLNI